MVVFGVRSASNLVCVSVEGDGRHTGCCLSHFLLWSKLFLTYLTGGKGELYRVALAVWLDWTAIATVSTKSRTGLTKISVAPCLIRVFSFV